MVEVEDDLHEGVVKVGDDMEDDALAKMSATTIHALQAVEKTLLALARHIRLPRSYVGYSAFILMALVYGVRPCAWEGATFVDMLDTFAPWAKPQCTTPCAVSAIPCALAAKAGGAVECVPISDQHPLRRTCHYLGGIHMPGTAVAGNADFTCGFEVFYAKIGVAVISTVMDGDCGLDVMCQMLGRPPSLAARCEIRDAISDYLMARIRTSWMHELMLALQELDSEVVQTLVAGCTEPLALPFGPPSAVAAPTQDPTEEDVEVRPDDETFAAMRWASCLEDDCNVLSLIRSLPKTVVDEQLRAYRARSIASAVAVVGTTSKLDIGNRYPDLNKRWLIAARFHKYCAGNGINITNTLPRGTITTFIRDHIQWKSLHKTMLRKRIRGWYDDWRSVHSHTMQAVGDAPCKKTRAVQTTMLTRAPVVPWKRQRNYGGGRPPKAPLVRAALYEWWSALRYSIDWTQLAEERRSRGKKCLARFPRSVLALKCRQLLADHAYACLLNGMPVETFKVDSWWCRRWEQEHGLSMRVANRKYEVPRKIQKERLDIHWCNLFRIRKFIILTFGYDPLIVNWDQSPFHHNETGAQDKPTLSVKGDITPIVQGNAEAKMRWTANLTTMSKFTAVAGGTMPHTECMFKATPDGPVLRRLQDFLRSRGFPKWFTVTVGSKGSYRENDIIAFLQKHLEPWVEGRDWRIIMADDFSAHKTDNVWSLCWSRGYILLIFGGGCTPVGQTCDTDLNQHVRKRYGALEANLLIEKMRGGDVVPKLSHEECMSLMLQVLSDPQLHKDAAFGYKRVGQSVEIDGGEDSEICREAGIFWNEATSDGFETMRHKLKVELDSVEAEHASGGLVWGADEIKKLITAYPKHKKTDAILEKLGDDFYHDDIHALQNDGDAEGGDDAASDTSDEAGVAVAEEHALIEEADKPECTDDNAAAEALDLSAAQADKVHQLHTSIAVLESMIDNLKGIGQVSSVQHLEAQLRKEKRQEREIIRVAPAVAESFGRLRAAESQEDFKRCRLAAQQKDRKRDAAKAIGDHATAVAALRKTRKLALELEGTRVCTHALKTYPLKALGSGCVNAGGPKAKKLRCEVLDRLALHKACLSGGQKNDWAWFKSAWDDAMVLEHGTKWADVFSGWLQRVLEDERSNAFSVFVYEESSRVFKGVHALHVPGH